MLGRYRHRWKRASCPSIPPRIPFAHRTRSGQERSRQLPHPCPMSGHQGAPAARGVPAHLARRHRCPRLGPVRFRLRLRRRVRRSPELRHGHHHPRPRGARVPRGYHLPARLDRSREHRRPRRAAPRLPRLGRQHGLDGQPLHREQETATRGRLHPRRRRGRAAQPRRHGLRQPHPPHVQGQAHHHRRHRGEPAPPGALRLLAGQAQALRAARLRRRHPALRHGRALDRRGGRRTRRRAARGSDHLRERLGVSCERARCARQRIRLRAAPQLGRPNGRPPYLRALLQHPAAEHGPHHRKALGGALPERRLRGAKPAGGSAHHGRDGRGVGAPVRPPLAPRLRRGRWYPRLRRNPFLHQQ